MSNIEKNLYPEITPYNSNLLKVTNLHAIFYEECGNPNGKPVIFLHGGPGSGCNASQRRFFDPEHYRIILTDQRGCGRSKPLGAIEDNNTEQLIADIDALRQHLGIAQWQVFGGSWGSTLGLAYAIAHPENVTGLILRGIFLSRMTELNWFLGEVNAFYPEAVAALHAYLDKPISTNVLDAYAEMIFSDDTAISLPASIAWNAFESSIMALRPSTSPSKPVDPEIQIARARVQIHYIQHQCFVGNRDMISEANKVLASIPTIIVQGRYDMVCPPVTAWELKNAMPHAEYIVVDDAGHSAMEPGTISALVNASEQFKSL